MNIVLSNSIFSPNSKIQMCIFMTCAWMPTGIRNQKMIEQAQVQIHIKYGAEIEKRRKSNKPSTMISVHRYTFSSSTRRRCSIIVYVNRNWDSNRVGFPTIKFFKSLSSGISSRHIMITVPMLSSPLLPARPAIWIYSPGSNFRCSFPSNFLKESNTTCWVNKNALRASYAILSLKAWEKQVQPKHSYSSLNPKVHKETRNQGMQLCVSSINV